MTARLSHAAMEAVVLTWSQTIFANVRLDLPVSSIALLSSENDHPKLAGVPLVVLFSCELQ